MHLHGWEGVLLNLWCWLPPYLVLNPSPERRGRGSSLLEKACLWPSARTLSPSPSFQGVRVGLKLYPFIGHYVDTRVARLIITFWAATPRLSVVALSPLRVL